MSTKADSETCKDGRPIQVVPKEPVSKKVDLLRKQIGTSRAGFCLIALEFVLPKIESGEMALVNGKLRFVTQGQ